MFPGSNEPIIAKLAKYEHRKAEVSFWFRKNESESAVSDGCFATRNEMLRVNEGDKDSDIPYLVGPPEIQHLLDTHASLIEIFALNESETASRIDPLEIQGMIGARIMLVEEGSLN